MKVKYLYYVLSVLVATSMVLAGCGAPPATATEPPVVQTEEPVSTEVPTEVATEVPTEAPTAEPTTRHGGWLDEIDISVVAGESAISQIQADAIDFYSFALASDQFPAIEQAGLSTTRSVGGYYGISLNPAVFTDTSVLNPFSNRKIREALNWLIDRNYINQEIYAGGSLPKLLPLTTQLAEYTNLIDTARALEAKYAYNPDKAKEVIDAEMPGMGAELGSDGKWQFNGQPVSLIFLIRSDGDGTRQPMGDYVANQLETVGFTVDRQYKTSSEAFPIWLGTSAEEGQWHLYTAGYTPGGFPRDERTSCCQQAYLNTSIQASEPFISNVADPEFQQLGDDLAQGNFSTKEERDQMMKRALELALEDSLFVWTIDQQSYAPYDNDVQATWDLALNYEGSSVGPYNLRFKDKEGGVLKIGTNDLYTEPWNTVAGSNWLWDSAVMRATTQGTSSTVGGGGLMADPFTGLAFPQRIESAELTYKEGLPIVQNLDWLTVKTESQIDVPEDAWVDWDAANQKWITAAEKFPEGTTANVKSVVTYPADLFDTVKWHDGSPISVGDFVMAMIQGIDPGKAESPIYDEDALAPSINAALEAFKGYRITSTDPLTIEAYSDAYNSDAELNILTLWPLSPFGLSGEDSWPVFAISNLAEANKELAYSADKADVLQVEQTSWVGGPSLEILSKYLDQAAGESYIPYEPTLGQYITKEEADLRYANLQKWFEDHGHFWVGTGPYYLDQVFTTEKTAVLKQNADFPDLADRWSQFSEPKFADTALDGPAQIKAGEEAVFDATVTFKDQPYAQSDIKSVKYILYDASGAVAATGEATPVEDGHYQVTLDADATSKLTAGASRLEVAVVPIPVAVPSFTSLDFVSVP